MVFLEAHYIVGWISSRKQIRLTVGLPRRGQGNIDRKELAAYIDPDAYLAEMAKHFHCSVVAVFYALRSMGITRKKDHNVYGAGACIKWKTTCNSCDVLVIIRLFMLMKQAVVPNLYREYGRAKREKS